MNTCDKAAGIHVYRRKEGWEKCEYSIDEEAPIRCMPRRPLMLQYPSFFKEAPPPEPDWFKNRPRPVEDPVRTFAGFQRFTEIEDRRFEFVDGKVRKKPRDTLRHAKITRNLYHILQGNANPDTDYVSKYWAVRIQDDELAPDCAVSLNCEDLADPLRSFYRTGHDDPQFVAEVLDGNLGDVLDGNLGFDDFDRSITKLQIYQKLPHLDEILLVSQNKQRADLFRRNETTDTWPDDPIVFTSNKDEPTTVTLTSLRDLTFNLGDLYRGTSLDRRPQQPPSVLISISLPDGEDE